MNVAALTRAVLESKSGSAKFAHCARALAEAAFAKDRALAREATRAIFARIVGPWSDSFDPKQVDSYVWFMTEAVYAPRSPVAAVLTRLGLPGPEALRERYRRIRGGLPARSEVIEEDWRIKRVVVLSRVALREDIAVTSVFLRAASVRFRKADVTLIAPRKNAYLLASPMRTDRSILAFGRNALFADRLKAWLRVRSRVQKIIAGLHPGEWLVIDPDSRFTQLGLLPVTDDRFYEFFESRSVAPDDPTRLGNLAGSRWWMDFVYRDTTTPAVEIGTVDSGGGSLLRRHSSGMVAAVSFAVGRHQARRLGDEFEDGLLDLLRRLGIRILLEHGSSEEDVQMAERRIAAFRGSTSTVRKADDGRDKIADLMTFRGTPKGYGGWMCSASCFIGYDSATTHMAVALEVPTIEVFAGAPHELFGRRWTPVGEEYLNVIEVDGPADWPWALEMIEQALSVIEERLKRFSPYG